ncbi:translation initiation factor IF-2 [Candidatus Parcubacteria bacterium]|nr:translation initiation factor IF-2 [Candidatus Parcubacteria bacterium]
MDQYFKSKMPAKKTIKENPPSPRLRKEKEKPAPAPKKVVEQKWQRPPVVVVLGHVDHGKSSLLEAIKDFNITKKESGGITQHIGAYEVEFNSKKITFIDTPGHEAFSAMRTRGASVADIALLVIDAAQSVQPQTKEAIMAIRKAEIPMIVVLNKIDLPTANPEKIKGELAKIDIVVESMGGTIQSVEVSAKDKTGIDELLEMILLVTEMQELTADLKVRAEGLVIESRMDSMKGPIATVIVEKGVLTPKDIIATDLAMAKIKSMHDFSGKSLEKAYPSQPAIVLGFEKVPGVGEKFKSYATADQALDHLKTESQKRELNTTVLDIGPGQKVLNIILKGDVFGSIEAIEGMLKNLPQDQIVLRILKTEVGDVNETDVKLAETAKAIIIGFRVKVTPGVMHMMAKDSTKRVRIKTFDIIYELIQEIRNGMEKSLEAEVVRKDVGKIKALIIFFGEKNRQIVGGKITEGEIKKGLKLDVIRGDQKVGAGRIINLQRDKKDMDLLKKGDECGILFEGNVKVEPSDILQAYIEERQKGVL